MDSALCPVCYVNEVRVECGNQCSTYYCSQQCANAHYDEHTLVCIGDKKVYAKNTKYRERGFYLTSMKQIRWMRKHDIFSFLCLLVYGSTKWINTTLFAANGNWKRLSTETYNDIARKQGQRMMPYPIFETVYKFTLDKAINVLGVPLRDKTRKFAIKTKEQLLMAYPEMSAYLKMDPATFLRQFCISLQKTLIKAPRLNTPLTTFRGYVPINMKNTLTLDVSRYTLGQVIINWGFMSVTIDSRIAAAFTGPICCMVILKVPITIPVLMITSDSGDKKFPTIHTEYAQQEVLLAAGAKIKLGKRLGKLRYINYQTNKPVLIETIKATVIGFAAITI